MGIYRGIGGTGDSTSDANYAAVTAKAVEAAASATNAATSASAASSSASSAQGYANAASDDADAAAASASAAALDAAAAVTAKVAAELAETHAETAEANAETAEANAETAQAAAVAAQAAAEDARDDAIASTADALSYKNAAATSASNAASSASTATTQASNAATSASNAATSETNAATSASTANAAKDAALAALDSFDDRYLGAKATDPTLDNDGNALVPGALYYNTTDDVMKVYEGSSWVAAYASLSGALLAANNLSDLASASSARTNLGLGTAATTAASAYATAAQGTKADSALQINPILGTPVSGNFSTGTFTWPTFNQSTTGNAATATTATNVSGGTASVTTLTTSSTVTHNGGTANGVGYLNGSKVLTTGSALTFDGNTLTAVNTSGNAIIASRGSKDLRFTGNYAGANTHAAISTTTGMALAFMDESNEFMRLTSTGLGIGTSSPGYKLHVSGTGTGAYVRVSNTNGTYNAKFNVEDTGETTIGSHSSNNLWFLTGNTTRMTLDTSGNLGLGVTPSAWGGTYKALQLQGGSVISPNTSILNLGQNCYYGASGWTYANTGTANLFQQYDGSYFWLSAASGTAGTGITFSTKMTLDASGNLGIGTTSPKVRLAGKILSINNTSAGESYQSGIELLNNGASAGEIWANSGEMVIGSYSPGAMSFRTVNTERMRIDSSGNVGIGTTSPSSFGRLAVSGNGAFINNSALRFYNSNNTNWSVIDCPATDGTGPIRFAVGSGEAGRFDNSGNFLFNSGYGSVATAYGCRAWVNFNGTGTVAIRASGNVSSITDNGVGDYTVNFTNAMPDVNYSFVSSCGNAQSGDISLSGVGLRVNPYPGAGGTYTMTTSAIRLQARFQNATQGQAQDHEVLTVAFFR